MDVLYLLGSGSVWENNEIRFSLRSAEKNILDLGRVFIVGELPDFLCNVEHLAFPDMFGAKWKNAYTKTLFACKNPDLSDDFLLMNDDFFILKPIEASSYPFYYSKVVPIKNSLREARFQNTTGLTASVLPKKIKTFLNFAVHRPVRINKKMYLDMPAPDLNMVGFSPRAFYCNYYGCVGVGYHEQNLSPSMTEQQFEKWASEYTDISIFSQTSRNPVFQQWIQKKFPKPSRFEK